MIMLKLRKVLLFCAIASLSLEFSACGQTTRQGVRGGGMGTERAAKKSRMITGIFRWTTPGPSTPVNIYLVVGKEKALVIDTGYPGDIEPNEVKAITPLPFMVVNTHAHPDHSGSNNAFEKVYIHDADLESCRRYSGNTELVPINDGYIFDLGGKNLEVIAVPGHTPGSICLLDAQDGILFVGDTANRETWMQISNVPLETYKKSVERLLKWKNQYDLILPGHGEAEPVSFLTDLIACSDEILSGKVTQPAQQSSRGNSLQSGPSHRYGSVLLRYNPDNLREKND
jgi:hydroxyacylglutathione hydrolase